MNTIIKKYHIDKLLIHHYLDEVYESGPDESLKVSFKRTANKPIYPIAVVPHPEPDLGRVISGKKRLETEIAMGLKEVEVLFLLIYYTMYIGYLNAQLICKSKNNI